MAPLPRLSLVLSLTTLLTTLLLLSPSTHAIKFVLPPARFPAPKCVWNAAHINALVIVTAHVAGPGTDSVSQSESVSGSGAGTGTGTAAEKGGGVWRGMQRVDVEIVDSTPQRNVLLSKRDIRGETRLAVTAHAEGDVGVCFKNWQSPGE